MAVTAAELTGRIKQWSDEFAHLTGEPFVSEWLCRFLAQRFVEQGLAEDDPDVVRMRVNGAERKVRITGRNGQFLHYENVVGLGMGVGRVGDVLDRDKLTEILERIG